VRLSWGRRHRDGAISGFREGGVTGTSPGVGTRPPATPAGGEVRLPGRRRHRDRRRSDFRDDPVREVPHLGPFVDGDAGNVTLPGPGRAFPGPRPRPGDVRST